MPATKIIENKDGTITYERSISVAPNNGITVRLLKHGKACKGARVEITQDADGFHGKIIEEGK